jgi:membrane protein YqaA with SNARE-associated domain
MSVAIGWLLFTNSLLSTIPFSMVSGYVYPALLAFGEVSPVWAAVVASLGGVTGAMLVYTFGVCVSVVIRAYPQVFVRKTLNVEPVARFMRNYGPYLLVFHWLPVIGLVPFCVAVARLQLWKVILAIVMGQVIYRCFIVI